MKTESADRMSALGMVLLNALPPPDLKNCIAVLQSKWPESPSILDIETEGPVTTATVSGGGIGLVHVAAPVPMGDLLGPIAAAWHWPEAHAIVGSHQSHVICYIESNTLSAIKLHLLHTRMIAALIEASSACGVYLGSAKMVASVTIEKKTSKRNG